MEENMKGWSNLGVVETIFEEETEDLQSLSSPSLSPLSSPSSPLQSALDAWTTTTGKKPDVKIHVQDICFQLHKDPLISKSSYLKRQLTGISEFTLSPPLKLTADTFKQVAEFCYINRVLITPSNVAALRTAAELLEMDGDGDGGNDGSLRQMTESYFCMVIAVNRDFACKVFRSCLSLLPEAEQTACIPSRCVEALFSMDDGNGGDDGTVSCAEGIKMVSPEDFRVIADSMQRRFTRSHDLLYRAVDLYFLVYDWKISEEQKTQICSCIDCSLLSSPLLMHAVQNPRMPLRFVVQAMLIEQLKTHRSIFTALNTATRPPHNGIIRPNDDDDSPSTLGAILERDAALRQVAQLRAAINTTTSKIHTLEKELKGMKQLLAESSSLEKEKQQRRLTLMLDEKGGRSSSCRFSREIKSNDDNNNNNNKVERGQRGSVSSSMLRFDRKVGPSSSSSCLESDHHQRSRVVKRTFGQRLIRGLKFAFGVSKPKDHEYGKLQGEDGIGYERAQRIKGVVDHDDGNGVISTILELEAFHGGNPHHRSHSVS